MGFNSAFKGLNADPGAALLSRRNASHVMCWVCRTLKKYARHAIAWVHITSL